MQKDHKKKLENGTLSMNDLNPNRYLEEKLTGIHSKFINYSKIPDLMKALENINVEVSVATDDHIPTKDKHKTTLAKMLDEYYFLRDSNQNYRMTPEFDKRVRELSKKFIEFEFEVLHNQ